MPVERPPGTAAAAASEARGLALRFTAVPEGGSRVDYCKT